MLISLSSLVRTNFNLFQTSIATCSPLNAQFSNEKPDTVFLRVWEAHVELKDIDVDSLISLQVIKLKSILVVISLMRKSFTLLLIALNTFCFGGFFELRIAPNLFSIIH